ncbi:MAG: hypothetical protein HUK14_10495 [Muribaculaceae bacterium]|nr:hypothetical protein [Muribaculaceae bacterium]
MKLAVTLNEIEELISSLPQVKTYVKELHLNVVDDKHLDVEPKLGLPLPLFGEVTKTLKLRLQILGLNANTIQLGISTHSSMLDKIASKALTLVEDKIQGTGYVDLNDGTTASIHLDKIDKLKPILANFTPNDLCFEGGSAVLDFSYNPNNEVTE